MRSASRFVLLAAAIVFLGVGCAQPAPGKNANTAASNTNGPVGSTRVRPASGTITVTILADGEFDPTTVFVKAGTTVTWRNNDTKPHQPHSLVDENGKMLVEFGPKNPIAPGSTYSFTFEKVGRMTYQDTVNPAFGGAVEVVE